jgi:hypothetical protein
MIAHRLQSVDKDVIINSLSAMVYPGKAFSC